MAALPENRKQAGWRPAGMLQSKTRLFGRGRVVGRRPVPAVVVFNERSEQPHEPGLLFSPGAALAGQFSEAAADFTALLPGLYDLRNSLDWKLLYL